MKIDLLKILWPILLSICIALPASAANLDAFNDRLDSLTEDQAELLRKKYRKPQSQKNAGKQIKKEDIELLKPRYELEPSNIEKWFKVKGAEKKGGSDNSLGKSVKASERKRSEIERSKRIKTTSEIINELEVNKSFEGYIEKSRQISVSTDIQQFGYELFAGTPTTFAPATEIPVPNDYTLGPGDELIVDLYGTTQKRFYLDISRNGSVSLPNIGPLNLSGITFSKAASMIEELIKEKMAAVKAYVTMGNLRSIRVFVLGDVERPGSYTVSSLSTLSNALFVSGGIKKIGTLRKIKLMRNEKEVSSIDLYDFLLRGKTKGDVRLKPGDVIFVPPIGKVAGIAGEVIRPAVYELKGDTTVEELIKMAGGLHPFAYESHIQIERVDKKNGVVIHDLSFSGKGKKQVLHSGDLVKVFSVPDGEEAVVYLLGNIKRPGKRAFLSGMRISDLIRGNEDLLSETYYEYALIEREAKGNREPLMIHFDLGQVLSGKSGDADVELKTRDKLYVFHRTHFRRKPMTLVEGLVKSPGKYELKKDMQVIDLLLAAGGLLRDADLNLAELYRTDPKTKKVTVSHINLGEIIDGENREIIMLQDLDRLIVHSVWESKNMNYVTISGQVNKPDDYPFADNARISDLLIAGGSFTAKAYRKKAELTRFEIVESKKRESKHFEIDMEAVLKGDEKANIKLQPFDHLYFREIANWRGSETVKIGGEVQFPGEYPIEEGEKLSSLIDRAGGLTPEAYIYGARFSRESIAQYQKINYEEMADKLEMNVSRISVTPVIAGGEKNVERQRLAIEGFRGMVDKLRATEPDGRLVINLMGLEKLIKSKYDIVLQDGDELYVPKKPDSVLVMGEVFNANAFLYDPGKKSSDYIDMAGGLTEMGNVDSVYVVKADGSVEPGKLGWFSAGVKMSPGDIIVVPEEIKKVSGIELTKDITQIVYQLGLAAASFHAVGVFN